MPKSAITRKLDKIEAELSDYADLATTDRHYDIIDGGRMCVMVARETENVVRGRCVWTLIGLLGMAGLHYGDAGVEFYVGMLAYPALILSIARTAIKKREVTRATHQAKGALIDIIKEMQRDEKQK